MESTNANVMTWLQAAERVLREEGPRMHIKELTNRILELGMVNSSCTTSLETLLYRQTSKGNSKFVRVAGKMGWFGLKGGVEDDAVEKLGGGLLSETGRELEGDEGRIEFEGQLLTRKRSHQMSGSEELNSCSSDADSFSSSSDLEEDGDTSELVYHKKYNFIRKLARGIIYVSRCSEPLTPCDVSVSIGPMLSPCTYPHVPIPHVPMCPIPLPHVPINFS